MKAPESVPSPIILYPTVLGDPAFLIISDSRASNDLLPEMNTYPPSPNIAAEPIYKISLSFEAAQERFYPSIYTTNNRPSPSS